VCDNGHCARPAIQTIARVSSNPIKMLLASTNDSETQQYTYWDREPHSLMVAFIFFHWLEQRNKNHRPKFYFKVKICLKGPQN
jgi:hypothetical protein